MYTPVNYYKENNLEYTQVKRENFTSHLSSPCMYFNSDKAPFF